MNVSVQSYCRIVLVSVCGLALLSACLAAPMDTFYPTDETELTNPQRIQLLKELRGMMDLEEKTKEMDNKDLLIDGDATGLMRVLPQKRFRPFRTQTRAGGVALCLWKVCPAAPWLSSRQ